MPAYKTHSIHAELIRPKINSKIEINEEDMKMFAIGPDILLATDYKTFNYQHNHKVRDYFMNLLKIIKEDKLYNHREVMAYLYGQLDHYVLDVVVHPLIYYMTEKAPKRHLLDMHALLELGIDEYMMDRYGKELADYYKKNGIRTFELRRTINSLYKIVYGKENESKRYTLGIKSINILEKYIRRSNIVSFLQEFLNVGSVVYSKNYNSVIGYLNLTHELINNPVTGEKFKDSFDDLWKKSFDIALQTFDDVNGFLYNDFSIHNALIRNDVSYNTSLPCSVPENFAFAKKYK